MHTGKQAEENSRSHHVMEVTDNVVGVVQVKADQVAWQGAIERVLGAASAGPPVVTAWGGAAPAVNPDGAPATVV